MLLLEPLQAIGGSREEAFQHLQAAYHTLLKLAPNE